MPVPRLVVHENPEGRSTPNDLLERLRQIDSTVELVYFGARDWRLGAVRPNDHRFEAGCRILAFEARRPVAERNPKNVYLALLLRQGFAQIRQYFDFGDPSGVVVDADGETTTIVRQFQAICAADLAPEAEREANVAAGLAEAGGASRKKAADEQLRGWLANDGRGHWRREMKGKVSFGHGGMTGGSGRSLIYTPGTYTPSGPILTGPAAAEAMAGYLAELASSI